MLRVTQINGLEIICRYTTDYTYEQNIVPSEKAVASQSVMEVVTLDIHY